MVLMSIQVGGLERNAPLFKPDRALQCLEMISCVCRIQTNEHCSHQDFNFEQKLEFYTLPVIIFSSAAVH